MYGNDYLQLLVKIDSKLIGGQKSDRWTFNKWNDRLGAAASSL